MVQAIILFVLTSIAGGMIYDGVKTVWNRVYRTVIAALLKHGKV